MIDESHAHEGHRRNFLRRAVAPNLFTSAQHPEFIPALVVANLMTPCLWEWARKSVDKPSGPVEALHQIHHFLNQRFHHATGETFAALWGLQERRHITDPDEREASDYVMEFLERCYAISTVPWAVPVVPLLKDGLFPLYVYGTADVQRVHGKKMGKRLLGVTSCLDECVLAASLALAAGVCRWEDIVFVGSPLHYTVFFLTPDGTVWLNAKREIFTQAAWEELCVGADKAESRLHQLHDRFTIADRVICADGLAVFQKDRVSGRPSAVTAAVAEVERFTGVSLPWLHPLPAGEGDGVFAGWEVISSGCSGEARGVQAAVLERARQGGAPMLDAALYMFRHPDFCHPEVFRHAARKNFYAYLHAISATSVEDIHAIVDAVPGRESFYGPGGRMALPDEVLAFGTASEAERALMREVMHEHFAGR